MKNLITNLLIVLSTYGSFFYPNSAAAEPAAAGDSAPIHYRNPAERREAGLGAQLTDWLKVSWLLELEQEREEIRLAGGQIVSAKPDPTSTLQFAMDIGFSDDWKAEVVFEAEYDRYYKDKLEEAVVNGEIGNWGVEFGRMHMPFGEYYSHFVTGPFLEFSETLSQGLAVNYSIGEWLEITAYGFQSDVDMISNEESFDWGTRVELTGYDEAIKFGIAYISDITENDEQWLKENQNRYQQRASAWTAYFLMGFPPFELTLESVAINQPIVELDAGFNRPSAHNVELVYYFHKRFQVALRYELSEELEDQPEYQTGINFTWRASKHMSLGADFLYGEYAPGVVDDNDVQLEDRKVFALQAALEF